MASTEAAVAAVSVQTLAVLTPDTQAMLDALVAQSGWNQTPQDWAIFAREGTVCAVRDAQGQIVASGAVLPLGEALAWISMVLVAPDARGQGLGRAMFAHCLALVKAAGRIACLDATPAGERIYARFGFVPLFRLTRWQRDALPGTSGGSGAAGPQDIDALAALDAQALGAPRKAMLADFLARPGTRCVRSDQGFAISRRGRVADQIGPLTASDEASAGALLALALQGLAGKVFIDVPDARVLLGGQLRDAGFAPQRGLVRMVLGDPPARAQFDFIHAIAGPEFG